MDRPNILYLHSHDTGRYIQPYGYDVPTPNLQRLAEGGVLFRQAFCANPTCSASRAALLTGQCAHSSGMLGLAHRGFSLKDYGQHLVATLRANGYHTALAGTQHVAGKAAGGREAIGYDELVDGSDHDGEEGAVRFLERPPQSPFFLACGFGLTHRPFPEPGPEDDPRYVRPPAPIPDAPETRRDMAAFRTVARRLDVKMGAVLDALDRAGLAANTLVICTTDHGIAFPHMKCHLTDHGIGVMLLLRGPDFTGGRVCDELVSHVDIFPTLCDLLGIGPPPWLQGHSFLPWARGEAWAPREEIFAEVNVHAAIEPMRCVRTRRWKYLRRYDRRGRPVLCNIDASPTKDWLLARGLAKQPRPAEELYDLAFDPNEAADLAADPAHADTLAELRARLDRWMRRTEDPLLEGRLHLPPGILVNPVDGVEPRDGPQRVDQRSTWPDDYA